MHRTLAATNATTSTADNAIPFADMSSVGDTLVHILGFIVVLAAAHPLGLLFPRLARLPLITGYLLVGILTGPFATNLVTSDTVTLLAKSINAMALSFISFQAGQEIYLPELKPQIKDILTLLFVLYGTAMLLLTLVLWLGASPFFYGGFDSSCQLAIALLFGSIAVLGSPATVMAIKIELNSNGPFTNLMLGATMTAEFVVLLSFSVSRVVASVYCAKLDISLANLCFTLGIVFANVLVGALIGVLTIGIFVLPGSSDSNHHSNGHDADVDHRDNTAILGASTLQPRTATVKAASPPTTSHTHTMRSIVQSLYVKGFVWLFLGYVFYIGTSTVSDLTIAAFGHAWDVKLEPLLVLMTASCLAGHYATIRHDMHVILDTAAPFVFLPFFVMTGAALKLDQVSAAIPLMSLFVGLRYVAIFIACYVTGRFVLKLSPKQYNNLWLTMTPQAGVALGLANEIKGLSADPWAAEFAATIVAAVVVNQIIGPVLCAIGLKRAGESSDSNTDGAISGPTTADDIERGLPSVNHARPSTILNANLLHVRSAIVMGNDDTACELAIQLALHGASVQLPLLCADRTARWQALQTTIQRRYAVPHSDNHRAHESSSFVELRTIVKHQQAQQAQLGPDNNAVSIRETLTAATTATDIVFFTGSDARRTLEYVQLLAATATSNRNRQPPRLVAITQDVALLAALRKHDVLVVQRSLALANVALRIGLSTDRDAALLCLDSCPCDATSRAAALIQPVDAASTNSTNNCKSVQQHRLLCDRQQLLQRNVRRIATGNLHLVPHDALRAALGLAQLQPPAVVAPTRVSMFGRLSLAATTVQGQTYFRGSSSRSRNTNRANRVSIASRCDGRGDIYVMGDDNEPASPLDAHATSGYYASSLA